MPFPSDFKALDPAEVIDFDSLNPTTTTSTSSYKQQQQQHPNHHHHHNHNQHNHQYNNNNNNHQNNSKKKYSAVAYDYNAHNENERVGQRVFRPTQNRNFPPEQYYQPNPASQYSNQPYRAPTGNPRLYDPRPPYYANSAFPYASHQFRPAAPVASYGPSRTYEPAFVEHRTVRLQEKLQYRKNLKYGRPHSGPEIDAKENSGFTKPFNNPSAVALVNAATNPAPGGSAAEIARNGQQSGAEKVGEGATKKQSKAAKKRAKKQKEEEGRLNSVPPASDRNESNVSPREDRDSTPAGSSTLKPPGGKQSRQQEATESLSTTLVANSLDDTSTQSRQLDSNASSSNGSSRKLASTENSSIVSPANSSENVAVPAPHQDSLIETSGQSVLQKKNPKKKPKKKSKKMAAMKHSDSQGQNSQHTVDQRSEVEDLGEKVPRESVEQKSKRRGNELLAFALQGDEKEPAPTKDGTSTTKPEGKPRDKSVLQPPILVAEQLLPSSYTSSAENILLDLPNDDHEPAPVKKMRTRPANGKREENVIPQRFVASADEDAAHIPSLSGKSPPQTAPASQGDAYTRGARIRRNKVKPEEIAVPQPFLPRAENSLQSSPAASANLSPAQSSPALQAEPALIRDGNRKKGGKGKAAAKSMSQNAKSMVENSSPPQTATLKEKPSQSPVALDKDFSVQSFPASQGEAHAAVGVKAKQSRKKKGKPEERSTLQPPILSAEMSPTVAERVSSAPLSALAKSFQSQTRCVSQSMSHEPVAVRDGNQNRRKKGKTEEKTIDMGENSMVQPSMAAGAKYLPPPTQALPEHSSQPSTAGNVPHQTPLAIAAERASQNVIASGSSLPAGQSYPHHSHGDISQTQSYHHQPSRHPRLQPYELYPSKRRSPTGQTHQYQGFPTSEPFFSGRTTFQQQDQYESAPLYEQGTYRPMFYNSPSMPGQHRESYGTIQPNRSNMDDERRRSFQPTYHRENVPFVMNGQQRDSNESTRQQRPNSYEQRRSSFQPRHQQGNGPASNQPPVNARQGTRNFGTGRRRPPQSTFAPGSSNYQQIQAYHNLPQRQLFEPRDGQFKPRRLFFTEYLAMDFLRDLLATNKINRTFYSGALRVNKKRSSDAYVAADGLLTDVYIPGNRLRNRAFDGDLVVVRIITEEEAAKWFPKEKFSLRMGGSLTKRIGTSAKENDQSVKDVVLSEPEEEDVEESDSDEALVGDEISVLVEDADVDPAEGESEKLFGEVVGILEMSPFRKFAGTISIERPGSKSPKIENGNVQTNADGSEKSESTVVGNKEPETSEEAPDEVASSEKIVVKGKVKTVGDEPHAKKTVRSSTKQEEVDAVEPEGETEEAPSVDSSVKVAKKVKGKTSKGDKVKKVSKFERLSMKRTPEEAMNVSDVSDNEAEGEGGTSEKDVRSEKGKTPKGKKASKGVRATTKGGSDNENDASRVNEAGDDQNVDLSEKVTKKTKGKSSKGEKTGVKKGSKFARLATKRTAEEEADASETGEDEAEQAGEVTSSTKVVRDGKGKIPKGDKAGQAMRKPNPEMRDALDTSEDEKGEKIAKNQKVRSFEAIEGRADKGKNLTGGIKAKVTKPARLTTMKPTPGDERDALDTSEDEAGNQVVKVQRVRTINIVENPALEQAKGTGNNGNVKDIKKRSESRYVWFQPTDKRAPLMVLEAATVPREFIEDPESFKNHLYLVKVVDWPATVQHPCARFIKDLGVMGEIKVETEALLQSNGVEPETFSSEVLNCLPKTPWTIPPSEFKTRRDMRKDRIFTIDPSTARDLDDAISCRRLDDGNYEIGVHIADVSYFVKPKTRLDAEAMNRATTVYLVQQIVPMLPPLLCEQLCSLNPGVDRLAFSVIWIMTPNAKIVDTWFGRTIIRSACKLSYEHAQTVIEGGKLDSEIPLVGATAEEIEADILIFFEFSKKLRSGRYEDGALSMNSIKLTFELDEDGLPTDCSVYQQKESNRLIEEFMLLANMSVAKKISSAFPEQALLRRHAPPAERRMNDFEKAAAKLGFDLDVSSAGRLQESFNQLEKEHGSEVVTVLKLLCIKPMMRAKYFCTGCLDIEMFGHYALNVPLYTHFTSPIRRYADVMVHRMLETALARRSRFSVDTERIQKIADNCNRRKDASKSAQDESGRLFLSALLHRNAKSRGGQPVESEAIVIQVQDRTFNVLVPAYGVEARIHLEDLPLAKFSYEEKTSTLKLYWKKNDSLPTEERNQDGKNDETSSRCQILKTLSRLTVALDANFKKSPPIINVSVPHPF